MGTSAATASAPATYHAEKPTPTSASAATRCFSLVIQAWRCTLTVSKPVLKARLVSALETKM